MPVLVNMSGAPFSGKTTLEKRIASATGSRYLSLDDLMRERGLDLSQSQPVEEWERTHQACFRLMAAALPAGESVVIDDTNYMRWLRDRFRQLPLSTTARSSPYISMYRWWNLNAGGRLCSLQANATRL